MGGKWGEKDPPEKKRRKFDAEEKGKGKTSTEKGKLRTFRRG